jgi:hypothetical protein
MQNNAKQEVVRNFLKSTFVSLKSKKLDLSDRVSVRIFLRCLYPALGFGFRLSFYFCLGFDSFDIFLTAAHDRIEHDFCLFT